MGDLPPKKERIKSWLNARKECDTEFTSVYTKENGCVLLSISRMRLMQKIVRENVQTMVSTLGHVVRFYTFELYRAQEQEVRTLCSSNVAVSALNYNKRI